MSEGLCQNVLMTTSNDILVVAGLSARALAELAHDEGFVPIALDLFGDRDTLAVSDWRRIGREGALAIDRGVLVDVLALIARERNPIGWIAGSGFEAHPGLLADAARCLDLIGNPPALADSLRRPEWFYPQLTRLGIPHAETQALPPVDRDGWLLKNARACGGWHVRDAALACATDQEGGYFQRRIDGQPMSVLFIADGRRFVRVGVARQRVGALAGRQWVFKGAVAAGEPGRALTDMLDGMIGVLVSALGLRGLNGIDFILNDDGPHVIELNPRPTASVSLFRDALAGGLLRAHVAASRGCLPVACEPVRNPLPARGFEVVFSRRGFRMAAALADWVVGCGWCADLPATGATFDRNDPVCTVFAQAGSSQEVEALLDQRRVALLARIDACASEV